MKAPFFTRIFVLMLVISTTAATSLMAKDEIHSYRVYVGGLTVGTLNMSARIKDGRYAAVAKVIGGGLVGAIFDLHFSGRADGRVSKSGKFSTLKYSTEERDDGKTKKRLMTYSRGTPTSVKFTPERKRRSYDAVPAQQGGTIDPISASLFVLRSSPKETACNKTVEIFDGTKRTRISLNALKPAGTGKYVCSGIFSRLSGYSKKQLSKKKNFPFTMHFKEQGDELVVTKFEAASIFGQISAVRR